MSSSLWLKRFTFSFPIQLVVLLLKKNHVLLLYWLLLFGFVTGFLSQRFGIPYLFLDAEYMGQVGFKSFFIIGFFTGCFVMVFNISSYIINAFRFPFIATLSRPFMKYTMNNFIVPLLFILVYLWQLISFQLYYELHDGWTVFLDAFGFLSGLTLIIFFTLTYFFKTNRDIIMMFGVEASDTNPANPYADHVVEGKDGKKFLLRFKVRWAKSWRVDTYLSHPFKAKLVRRTEHYKKEMLEQVFRQNHLNAAVIEIVVFILFIVLGLFKEYSVFQIPAGASIILIFSMFLMITSAFRFWLKSWATSAFIFLIILINIFSQLKIFHSENKAYGMNYEKRVVYSLDKLKTLTSDSLEQKDYARTIKILDAWRAKFTEKPKIVFINCSGGGSRAAMWTFRVMQYADSITNNCFIESTQLITGASGGMIGAAYYRELYLNYKNGLLKTYNDKARCYNTAKDLLNPIAFSITVSDLFFSFQKFKVGKTWYAKDRAYVFERQLNRNMEMVFGKTLRDYRTPEREARIPMMLFSPTIVNDGRRLLISPQDISYLTHNSADTFFNFESSIDGIEFRKFFEEQDAGNVRFTSVLRMSSTFPYVLPEVSLPSEPALHMMDAGIRDNTGMKSSLRFMYVFRKWIEENTSGVVMVDVRDSHRMRPMEPKPPESFLTNAVNPMGNIYNNLLTMQDYNIDEVYDYARSWFGGKFDYITFELPTKEQEISLSWHLTTREKNSVYNTVNLPLDKKAFEELEKVLRGNVCVRK